MSTGAVWAAVLVCLLLIIALDEPGLCAGTDPRAVSSRHLFTTVAAMTMTGILVAGIVYRPRRRILRRVAWVSLALLAFAAANALILYLLD